MKGLRLYKKEKLCSVKAIDALFAKDSQADSALAFPLRAIWRENNLRSADCPQFIIVVPKRRLRHAVDRVAMRRRIREAYRLSRDLIDRTARTDIAFVYVADTLRPYASVERAMHKLLKKIAAGANHVTQANDANVTKSDVRAV